jgi:hypothetical protein
MEAARKPVRAAYGDDNAQGWRVAAPEGEVMEPCRSCGAETESSVTLTGLVEVVAPMCEPCFEKAMRELADHRRMFELMIENGVSREQANRIMIKRIDPHGRFA